jgi:hypothetical protein
MSTRRRAWFVVAATALVVASFCTYSRHRASEIESAIQNRPLKITASQTGRFARGFSWELQVGPTGSATLNIYSVPTEKTRRFVVSQAQIDELRAALQRERFFDLGDSYGELVADSSTTTLELSAGEFTKRVNLLFFGNWIKGEKEKLRDPSRALRVLMIIRGWFNDPGAVDLREYDQPVIDAASKAN